MLATLECWPPLPQALASYQASLAIRERLTKSDPGNAQWQRDLAVSYAKLANANALTGASRFPPTPFM